MDWHGKERKSMAWQGKEWHEMERKNMPWDDKARKVNERHGITIQGRERHGRA
jgi:hypothetical protein